jgi:hypothetical protein
MMTRPVVAAEADITGTSVASTEDEAGEGESQPAAARGRWRMHQGVHSSRFVGELHAVDVS